MLMIRPNPRSSMPGRTALTTRSCPLKLTSRILSQNSSVVATNGMKSSKPALFTTTSTGPSSAAADATAASTDAAWVTSTSTGTAVPPASAMSLAVRVAVSRFRSATATRKPPAASAVAMPRPMPCPAPVTKATRLLMTISPVGSGRRRLPGKPWRQAGLVGHRRHSAEPLHEGGGAEAAAAAHGDQAGLGIPAFQLGEQGREQPPAGRADRMAEGDGAAVDVHPVHVRLELPFPGQHHGAER